MALHRAFLQQPDVDKYHYQRTSRCSVSWTWTVVIVTPLLEALIDAPTAATTPPRTYSSISL